MGQDLRGCGLRGRCGLTELWYNRGMADVIRWWRSRKMRWAVRQVASMDGLERHVFLYQHSNRLAKQRLLGTMMEEEITCQCDACAFKRLAGETQ